MVGTIAPIVYGDQKKGARILGLHIGAYIFGSLILGAALGSLGLLLVADKPGRGWTIPAVAVASILCGTRELGLIAFPLPRVRWQVPAKWRRLPLEAMAILYGLVLGMGVANYVGVSTFHVAVLWATLSRNPLLAACVFLGFGIGRAMHLVWLIRGSQTVDECLGSLGSIGDLLAFVRVLSGLGLSFVGSCLLSAWLVG